MTTKIYVYINKETKDVSTFTSLKACGDESGVGYETLKYHFTRNKESEYEKENFRIIKTVPKSSIRAKTKIKS